MFKKIKKVILIMLIFIVLALLGLVLFTIFFDQAIIIRKHTFYHIQSNEKVVALTFDDGPDPRLQLDQFLGQVDRDVALFAVHRVQFHGKLEPLPAMATFAVSGTVIFSIAFMILIPRRPLPTRYPSESAAERGAPGAAP